MLDLDNMFFIVPPTITENFAFVPGVTAFSTIRFVFTATTLYILSVGIVQSYIKWRGKPFGLSNFSYVYNWCLSAMSAILLVALLNQIKSRIETYGFWSFFCNEHHIHIEGPHIYIYFVIYLTKYLEYCDTILLCLRGKQVPFIHLYHHAVTAFFAYIHLHEQTCIYWTMAAMNLFVHVILYAYFALLEKNRKIWWKQWLTFLQVFQFYATFVPSLVAFIPRVLAAIDPGLPYAHACHGSWGGSALGFALLFIYLILFQRLYSSRYSQKMRTKSDLSLHLDNKNSSTKSLLPTKVSPISSNPNLSSATMWGQNANYSFRHRK